MTLEVARFDSYGIPLAPTLRHVRLAELVNKLLLHSAAPLSRLCTVDVCAGDRIRGRSVPLRKSS